jgi:hypothetical protein
MSEEDILKIEAKNTEIVDRRIEDLVRRRDELSREIEKLEALKAEIPQRTIELVKGNHPEKLEEYVLSNIGKGKEKGLIRGPGEKPNTRRE